MSNQNKTLTKMDRSELEATIVSQTKVMERFRNKLGIIVLGIEDEGDRAYFGSTNDADELRKLESDMLDSLNILECPWMHGRDLHADLRDLRTKVGELVEALLTKRDYIVDAANGALVYEDSGEGFKAMAAEDLTRIDALIAKARGETA